MLQQTTTMRKILHYGVLLLLLGIGIGLFHHFIYKDWRAAAAEAHVEKSIVTNYENKKATFVELRDFLQDLHLPPPVRITFLDDNRIAADLSSPYTTDTTTGLYLMNEEGENGFSLMGDQLLTLKEGVRDSFSLTSDGLLQLHGPDNVDVVRDWVLDLTYQEQGGQYEHLIQYLGITKEEMRLLRQYLKQLDVEDVAVQEDGSVSLCYDGFFLQQYEYYLLAPTGTAPENYHQLEEGIYWGLFDSGLFCGQMVFSK